MSDESTTPAPSLPEDIQKAMMGGVPAGKWKEGLLFDGIRPTPG
jgi:hypothetical protein